jgi:hypothetical protein
MWKEDAMTIHVKRYPPETHRNGWYVYCEECLLGPGDGVVYVDHDVVDKFPSDGLAIQAAVDHSVKHITKGISLDRIDTW